MKVIITRLKAPWPTEAKIGDVIELQGFDGVPAWAEGKCKPAADDAEASQVLARANLPKVEAKASAPASATLEAVDPDALAAAQALLAEARIEADELRARVAKAEEALAQRDAELAEAKAALAKAEEALAAKAGKAKG